MRFVWLLCLIGGSSALYSEHFFQGIEILESNVGSNDFFASVVLEPTQPPASSATEPSGRQFAVDVAGIQPEDVPHHILNTLQTRVRETNATDARQLLYFAQALLLYGRRPEFRDQMSAMLRLAESSLRSAQALSGAAGQSEFANQARELLAREFATGSQELDRELEQVAALVAQERLNEAETLARNLAHRTSFRNRRILRQLEAILRQRALLEADSDKAALLHAEANFIASGLAESEAEAQIIESQTSQSATGQATEQIEAVSDQEVVAGLESAHIKTRSNRHEEALQIYRELARKTSHRSAKVRFYLGSHLIVMAGKDEFRSRREELRREGNSHLTEARKMKDRFLDQYPDNARFSEEALRLQQQLDSVTVEPPAVSSVDDLIRQALSENEAGRKDSGLQKLLLAVDSSQQQSAKAYYFLGKQYLLLSNRSLAVQALESAKALKTRYLQAHPQNGDYATQAQEKLAQLTAPVVSTAPTQELQKPVAGTVTSIYGMRTHPIHRTRRMHTGLDIGAARGTPLRAMANGKITFAGWISGYGNTVKIQYDNGYESLFAHMKNFNSDSGTSRVNQRVRSGEKVGEVNSTGSSTGDHLHLELKRNGERISPVEALGKSNRVGERF